MCRYLKSGSDADDTNPIDAFIQAGLTKHSLPIPPRADRRTLLRRATYNVTGLPPSEEETASLSRRSHHQMRGSESLIDFWLHPTMVSSGLAIGLILFDTQIRIAMNGMGTSLIHGGIVITSSVHSMTINPSRTLSLNNLQAMKYSSQLQRV